MDGGAAGCSIGVMPLAKPSLACLKAWIIGKLPSALGSRFFVWPMTIIKQRKETFVS